jgi:outer membrane protein TolC
VATANLRSAEFDLRTAGNEVYNTILSSYNELKSGEQQVRLYQKDVLPQAEEVFRTATKSYEAGEITYMEFLQAQQTIMSAKSNYVDVLLAYNLSLVSLEAAVGNNLR